VSVPALTVGPGLTPLLSFGFNTLNTTLMQLPYGAIIVALCVAFPHETQILRRAPSILGALYVNSKAPKGYRTYLMVATTIPTVVGFAMVAWAKPKAARLIGYCAIACSPILSL
jgi:hypothetical protein